MMRLLDENFHGRTVIASDGFAIDEIAVQFIDSDAWRVESLQVSMAIEGLRKVLPGVSESAPAHHGARGAIRHGPECVIAPRAATTPVWASE